MKILYKNFKIEFNLLKKFNKLMNYNFYVKFETIFTKFSIKTKN